MLFSNCCIMTTESIFVFDCLNPCLKRIDHYKFIVLDTPVQFDISEKSLCVDNAVSCLFLKT